MNRTRIQSGLTKSLLMGFSVVHRGQFRYLWKTQGSQTRLPQVPKLPTMAEFSTLQFGPAGRTRISNDVVSSAHYKNKVLTPLLEKVNKTGDWHYFTN